METKTNRLSRNEVSKLRKLQDPITELILINGWRNNEVVQGIRNWEEGNDFTWIRFKCRKKKEKTLLTEHEIALLRPLKALDKYKYNEAIIRHYKSISKQLGFRVTAHMVRKAFSRIAGIVNGESIIRVSRAMHHKSTKQTEAYIYETQEDILELKDNMAELKTLDGMLPHEMRETIIRQRKYIRRLERRNNEFLEMRNGKM